MRSTRSPRRVVVVDNTPLARAVGSRLRQVRTIRGLSQRQLAGDRYTPSYVSALENGLVKPSVAALSYLAERLGVSISDLLSDERRDFRRLEADLRLASGNWEEAEPLFRQLLDDPPTDRVRAEALRGLAEALVRLGRSAEAADAASQSAEAFRLLERPADAAQAVYWLASAAFQQENALEARSLWRTVLEDARNGIQLPTDLRLRTLIALANADNWEGEHSQAAVYLEEARALTSELDERKQATFLMSLAMSYRDSGDLEGALRAGERSLGLFQAAAASREVAITSNSLALTYLRMGSLERAREFAREAEAAVDMIGDAGLAAHMADTKAQIALAAGHLEEAKREAETAIARAGAVGNEHALLDALLTRARVAVQEADPVAADEGYGRAAELVRYRPATSRRRAVLNEWADFVATQGRHEAATALFREALQR